MFKLRGDERLVCKFVEEKGTSRTEERCFLEFKGDSNGDGKRRKS